MDYLFLTAADKLEAVARAMYSREQEHLGYEHVRVIYEEVLKSFGDLPAEWPANLEKYKTVFGEKLAIANLSAEDLALVARLQHRDRAQILLKTNNIERDKGVQIYDALLPQLPADPTEKTALINKIKAEMTAQKAKAGGV